MADQMPSEKTVYCSPPCLRKFKTAAALAEHRSHAARHARDGQQPTNSLVTTTDAAEVVGQSTRGTAANRINETAPRCALCNKVFVSKQALASHVRDSPRHGSRRTEVAGPTDTPLDRFFKSHTAFSYDKTLPPEESFRRLERHFGWDRRSAEKDEAWKDYQSALVEEVRLWFGDDNDIAAWHQLCRAVGIRDPPPTMNACEREVRRTHVNIVDLITWGRLGQPSNSPVNIFDSVEALSEYTFRTKKFFPKEEAIREDGETNIVLRHLLRKLLRPWYGGVRFGAF